MGFGTILHCLGAHWSCHFSPNVFQALLLTFTSPLSPSPASPRLSRALSRESGRNARYSLWRTGRSWIISNRQHNLEPFSSVKEMFERYMCARGRCGMTCGRLLKGVPAAVLGKGEGESDLQLCTTTQNPCTAIQDPCGVSGGATAFQ
jgi:hypothetical protein